jgi:hypothetical protein
MCSMLAVLGMIAAKSLAVSPPTAAIPEVRMICPSFHRNVKEAFLSIPYGHDSSSNWRFNLFTLIYPSLIVLSKQLRIVQLVPSLCKASRLAQIARL